MDEIKLTFKKIHQNKNLIKKLKRWNREHRAKIALLLWKEDLEADIFADYNPEVSKDLDSVNFLLRK